MTRIYAWDDPKISSSKMKKLGLGTFANKESLKKAGMKYDPDVKHWYIDDLDDLEVDKGEIYKLGIILDYGIALGRRSAGASPYLMNFHRRSSFIDTARFTSLGKDIDGLEIFEIEPTSIGCETNHRKPWIDGV